ncbi:DUF4197 domain-containing protein [Fulvivirga sp. RKSG066]|uniref:DUF4197 domain-containing protein n=1 Tax=Fulvivirga aurantia TaxID=2529383 RepID=UPI0012BC3997|nr:DUF4197 domain-containing protein [Fulvivirga aurantia]MTI19994.1 DUF4197 domain-containing protein [Fulvivirga aurantia]
MKNIFKILACTSILFFASCEELENGLSNDEIIRGLKEALNIGLDASVATVSETDGYLKNEIVKILLPPEVKSLQDKVENGYVNVFGINISYSTILDTYIAANPNIDTDPFEELLVAMNRGAEKAANKALPIFGNALTTMTVNDALGILQGSDTSATNYFYNRTNQDLFNAFQPDVKNALDETKANDIYRSLVGFLNYEYSTGFASIKVADFINVSLPESIDGYATEKAIDGLFYYVGEEEKEIREDPFKWGSDIIEKVFGSPEANV